MSPTVLAFWVPVYLIAGTLFYFGDLRWGVALRKWCIDLVSPAPRENHEGFIVGRGRAVQFFWSCVFAAFTAGLMVLFGAHILWESLVGLVGAVSCLIGMQLGPASILALKGMGIVMDKMGTLEKTVKEVGPQVVDSALAKGKEVAQSVMDAVTPDPNAPTDEEVRQEKIDRMDELLGKKKREKDRS